MWNEIFLIGLALTVVLGVLPFIVAPFLPERFKSKAIIELSCTVQKAFEIITDDPRKCPMTGKNNHALVASRDDADKNGKPLKWREEIMKGRLSEIFTVEQTFDAKPGKTARVVRTSKHEAMNMETEWQYEIEPAGDGRCRVTLSGYTDIKEGTWQVPLVRFMMLMEGPKKAMKENLNMVADATGGKRKWISAE